MSYFVNNNDEEIKFLKAQAEQYKLDHQKLAKKYKKFKEKVQKEKIDK